MEVRLPSAAGNADSKNKIRRERLFQISLKALVEGTDAAGQKFMETTEVSAINSQMACFSLKARLLIGARLRLNVTVPPSLSLGGLLCLFLQGRVVRVQAQPGFKVQAVTIHLEQRFRLVPKLPAD